MPFVSSLHRTTGLALASASLILIAGCSEEKPAPPPNITVNPPASPPKPGRASDAGPGSSAASDSTLNH